VRKSIESSKKKKMKLETETRLLRMGLLPAQAGRRENSNTEKCKILKKKIREVEAPDSNSATSGICFREPQRLTLLWTDACLGRCLAGWKRL